jgi:hypothetical protein
VLVYSCNLSSQDAEARGLGVQGQLGLHSDILSQNKQKRDPEMMLFLLVLQGFPFMEEESLYSSYQCLPRFPEKVNLQ